MSNPLAVGTFCPTCGTRLSDTDHTARYAVHACPVCGDDERADDGTTRD